MLLSTSRNNTNASNFPSKRLKNVRNNCDYEQFNDVFMEFIFRHLGLNCFSEVFDEHFVLPIIARHLIFHLLQKLVDVHFNGLVRRGIKNNFPTAKIWKCCGFIERKGSHKSCSDANPPLPFVIVNFKYIQS